MNNFHSMNIEFYIQNWRIYILIKHTWKIYKKLCTRPQTEQISKKYNMTHDLDL